MKYLKKFEEISFGNLQKLQKFNEGFLNLFINDDKRYSKLKKEIEEKAGELSPGNGFRIPIMKFKTSKSGNGPDLELINRLKNEFTDLIISFGTFKSLDDAYVSVQRPWEDDKKSLGDREEEEYEEENPEEEYEEEEKPQTTGEVIIRPMTEEDVDDCLDLKYQYFGHFYGELDDPMTKAMHDNYALNKLDLSVSLVAEIDGKIVGGYILEKTGLPMYPGNFYDFSGEKLTGVEGVSLFVDPNYKSAGIGHKLKYYYKENKHPEISFIWGMAFHGLNNMNHWLKTRTMFNDLRGVYYTIEFYTPGGINKYPKTKYLDFYEQHKITVLDYINGQLKNNKKVGKIAEVLSDYGIEKSEVIEIANYCKKEKE